ncbi:HypC/HybG/HupF family hydrogenase formation chaperone [Methylobacterium sp. 092160098-2]|uniref:HypC/HybG/HupF family hydrogenase formation chaperone n=1 Tax=Methylobacterium sp. 092160098-2 TaxID=3025129 RepID=UPI0023819976|nr:HypC/HybG/HupF family hydrogenase formation chaperone [Methylobacterium sp. 092160098-2]MDE4914713.1 HypC/HybG/HupF family hydrogenase formation chaperone [Methylobacterium sp. 092160098-2]
MCLGIPMEITRIDGLAGQCRQGEETHLIDLSLLPDARVGDHVLTFLGTGRRLLDADAAAQITEALAAVAALMNGAPADIDRAFADLIDREPTLPPHLAALLPNPEPAS